MAVRNRIKMLPGKRLANGVLTQGRQHPHPVTVVLRVPPILRLVRIRMPTVVGLVEFAKAAHLDLSKVNVRMQQRASIVQLGRTKVQIKPV